MSIAAARRAIGSVCVWHLRVLTGWLPPHAGDAVRVFAARFEQVNIGDRLALMAGEQPAQPYVLGALAVAGPGVAAASSSEDVRAALRRSAWGDPGSVAWPVVQVALEARWTSWLAEAVPMAGAWAAGAAALVAARQLAARRALPEPAMADLRRQLGSAWERAGDLDELSPKLPTAGRWVLEGVDEPGDLWRAEGRWWRRVDDEATTALRAGRPGPAMAAAAAARLVADAWRAQAALEAAAWGRPGIEAFDVVA
jgi:hypothetical protein